MNHFLISGAAGCVSGIIAARWFNTPSEQIPGFLVAGLILLVFAAILAGARKTLWPAAFAAGMCLSMANTAWHYDTATPGHLKTVVDTPEFSRNVTLEGTVVRPPDLRERYTILPISVVRLTGADGIPVPVKRGQVYAKLYATAGDIVDAVAYGDRVRLQGVNLQKPQSATNPGAFDMRNFLYNQGYFAQVSIRNPEQITLAGSGAGNPLVRLAETIKSNILMTIKKTLPFPESSFLGGVLLGLRSGLSTEIKDTFRAAGVSHVLAVSGLHVTIITLFFMGILNLLRLPRTSCFVIIICALILFTLITGARPSTVRAAIMNSVTLLFFYYRGIKLDRSFLLGISVAALFILGRNPRLLTEASFLFSFSAVLSLALLTRPIHDLCCRYLRGFFRIFLFFELVIGTAVMLIAPGILVHHWQWTVAALILLPAGILADRILPPF
nr:ComEC family competence protein [bacterium]